MSNLGGKPLLPSEPSCQPYLFILFGWTQKLDAPRTSFSPTELLLSVSFPETGKRNGCHPLPVFASIPPPAQATLTLGPPGRSEKRKTLRLRDPSRGGRAGPHGDKGRRARGQSREPRSTWRSRGTAIEARAGSAGGRWMLPGAESGPGPRRSGRAAGGRAASLRRSREPCHWTAGCPPSPRRPPGPSAYPWPRRRLPGLPCW